jgi:DNA-binding transcriptional MerR regulator
MLTSKQFADRLGIHIRTLIRWHEQGMLVPAFIFPSGERRYTEDQIDALRGENQVESLKIEHARKEERRLYSKWQTSPLSREEEGFERWHAANERLLDLLAEAGDEVEQ